MVDVSVPELGRVCTKCAIWKSASEFYWRKGRIRLQSQCLPCRLVANTAARAKDPERFRAHERNSKARRKSVWKSIYRIRARAERLKKFGITEDQAKGILESQGGKCAICRKRVVFTGSYQERSDLACIDHDHVTGNVRGILCNGCNTGIGLLLDSATVLSAAASYLKRAKKNERHRTRGHLQQSPGQHRLL